MDTRRFEIRTTEDLYQICAAADDDPLCPQAIDFREGFLPGVVAYRDGVTDRRHLKPPICYPSTATHERGIAAFLAWAATHQRDQKYMNDPAVLGAVRELATRWPCKSQ